MKKKRIIPLVMFIFSALLIMGSVNVFVLKTRENEKTESTKGTIEINKISHVEEKTDNVSKESNSFIEITKEQNDETSNEVDNNDVQEKVEDKKVIVKDETTVSNNKVTEKQETQSNSNNNNNSTNTKTETKQNENKKEETQKQEPSTNSNQKAYEIPDEDSREKNNGSTDPEYLKIKASCEFFTRAECQAALDDIMDKYLSDEHPMVSTSCKSFAYNGEVVGYRVLITYGDGNYFYNN